MSALRAPTYTVVRVAAVAAALGLFVWAGPTELARLGLPGLIRIALCTLVGVAFLLAAVPTMVLRRGFGRIQGTPGVVTLDLVMYAPLFALDGWFAAALVGFLSHLLTAGPNGRYDLARRLSVGATRVPFWFLISLVRGMFGTSFEQPTLVGFGAFLALGFVWTSAFVLLWFDPLTVLRTGVSYRRLVRTHILDGALWLNYLVQIAYGFVIYHVFLGSGTPTALAALLPVVGLSYALARVHTEMLRSYRLSLSHDAVAALVAERDPSPYVRSILASINTALASETIEVLARDAGADTEWRALAMVGIPATRSERLAGVTALDALVALGGHAPVTAPNDATIRAYPAHNAAGDLVGALVSYRNPDTTTLGVPLALASREIAMLLTDFQTIAHTQYVAGTDALTGLLNRGRIERSLALEAARDQPCAVLLFDIDRFKAINDTLGHAAGDRTLARIGEIVTAHIRTDDVAGRFGGEEFLVVMPGADVALGRAVAERLRAHIEQSELRHADGSRVTASFGVTVFAAFEAIDEILERVDRALYAAKAQGRNCVVSSGPT